MLRENLLKLQDDLTVTVSEYALQIIPFRKVVENNGMEQSCRIFSYIYFMCDPRSKYMAYSEANRHEQVVSAIFPGGMFEVDPITQRAMEEYVRHDSSILLLLRAANSSVIKLREWLDAIDVTEDDYDAIKHAKLLADLGKTVGGLKTFEDEVKKELDSTETYGGVPLDKYNEA